LYGKSRTEGKVYEWMNQFAAKSESIQIPSSDKHSRFPKTICHSPNHASKSVAGLDKKGRIYNVTSEVVGQTICEEVFD